MTAVRYRCPRCRAYVARPVVGQLKVWCSLCRATSPTATLIRVKR
jgi:hypothetical protein